jgi:hypothetical protein
VDVDGGFGSVAQQMLCEFRDDFSRSSAVLCMGVSRPRGRGPPHAAARDAAQAARLQRSKLNEALAMQAFCEAGSLYVPVPLYNVGSGGPLFSERFRADSLFHASSLAAAGLDCISLPYRRARPAYGPMSATTLGEMCARLAPREDVRVAGLALALPFPYPEIGAGALSEMMAGWQPLHSASAPLLLRLSAAGPPLRPTRGDTYSTFGSSLVCRGVRCPAPAQRALGAKTLDDCLQELSSRTPVRLAAAPLVTSVALPWPVTLAQPDILRNSALGDSGELLPRPVPQRTVPPMSLPLIAHLETSTRHGGDVLRAYLAVKNLSSVDRFELSKGKGGLDEDELLEIKNRLGLMSEIYTEGLDVPEEITSIWRGSVDYD